MLPSAFCDLVGCEKPLQLAGTRQISDVELTAAVSNAGGLGMLAMPMMPPEALEAMLAELAGKTDGQALLED